MDGPYIVKPVFKALHVLRVVASERDGLSLSDVCARTGLPRSTAFKYLRTLAASGFVVHEPDRDAYRGGLLLWQLGQQSGGSRLLADVALPVMRGLVERFNETVNLAVLDGFDVIYVEILEGSRALRMHASVGSRDAAYATALGKVMLAHEPADAWRAHVPTRLRSRTPQTIVSIGALSRQLDEIRSAGHAWDREENEEGLSCVAAPVVAPDGTAVAAISVAAPSTRIPSAMGDDLVAAVIAAGRECSTRLEQAQDG